MEAIALDALLAEAQRDWIGACFGRHGGVESRVEAGEARCVGVELSRGIDEAEGGRDVERRIVNGGAKCVEDLRGDAAVLAQTGAAVDDAIADRIRLGS